MACAGVDFGYGCSSSTITYRDILLFTAKNKRRGHISRSLPVKHTKLFRYILIDIFHFLKYLLVALSESESWSHFSRAKKLVLRDFWSAK